MSAIDVSTPLGQLRLRCGDVSDMPFLPDSVYTTTYTNSNNNLQAAAKTCASYILAQLAFNTHEKLYQVEVWGAEAFQNYSKYLQTVILNPALSDQVIIAYGSASDNETNDLVQFIQDWNACYIFGTQSELLHYQAQGWMYDISQFG